MDEYFYNELFQLDNVLHNLAAWSVAHDDSLTEELTALGKARLALEEKVKEMENGH